MPADSDKKGRAMTRIMRWVAFAAAMSMSAAVVPATMDTPVRSPSTSAPPPATGATEVTPADPPARPNMVPAARARWSSPIHSHRHRCGGCLRRRDDPAPFPLQAPPDALSLGVRRYSVRRISKPSNAPSTSLTCRSDARARWPVARPLDERLYRVVRSLNHRFDCSIAAISHPAGHAERRASSRV